jgi:hypothetical protein
MPETTYNDLLERQKEQQRLWLNATTRQLVDSRRNDEPPEPPRPRPPSVDASAREHYEWWRTHQDSPLIANYLALTIGKLLDRIEELEARNAVLVDAL